MGKHRRRVSGIREQDERERSLSADNASRSNQDCFHIKALCDEADEQNGVEKVHVPDGK